MWRGMEGRGLLTMARPRSVERKRGHNLEENGEWYPKMIHGKSIQVRRCILCHNLRQAKWDLKKRKRGLIAMRDRVTCPANSSAVALVAARPSRSSGGSRRTPPTES